MSCGSQLAQHEAQNGHVRKFVERDAVEVEVAVGVGDAARGNVVAQRRNRRVFYRAVRGLLGSVLYVGYR